MVLAKTFPEFCSECVKYSVSDILSRLPANTRPVFANALLSGARSFTSFFSTFVARLSKDSAVLSMAFLLFPFVDEAITLTDCAAFLISAAHLVYSFLAKSSSAL
jgi:hypothetical protein